MNWPEIESIVYSECDHPQDVLGMHEVNGGFLIQAFLPGFEEVNVLNLSNDKSYLMERVDEAGFFACFIPSKKSFSYEYIASDSEGELVTLPEVYNIIPKFMLSVSDKLSEGTLYDSYKYFGAHITERKDILGTEFLVFAPNAQRVSVVGDFNNWDGRVNQMCKISEKGVFGLFIPKVLNGSLYKYEIKLNNGITFLKRDPFSFSLEKGKGDACRIIENPDFEHVKYKRKPISKNLCLLNLSLKDLCSMDIEGSLEDYVFSLVNKFSYDGILFEDFSLCFDRTVTNKGKLSFFSVCPENLRLKELIKLIDFLHSKDFKVFSTIEADAFIPDEYGLKGFDGSNLFDGSNPEIFGRISFDYSKPYVRNFMISVCDYFTRVLCLDGICLDGVDRIIYLDYGKKPGEWTPNVYGGNENLGGIEFIKHYNSIIHKRYSNFFSIARGSLYSNNLTYDFEENGLGFDLKIHALFDKDFFSFLSYKYKDRPMHYGDLLYSPVYIYCEKFILSYLYSHYGKDEKACISTFPGSEEEKKETLRLSLAYIFAHPGCKCLSLYDFEDKKLEVMLSDLIALYKSNNDSVLNDDNPESFSFVENTDSKNLVLAFIRRFDNKEYLVVCNFSNKEQIYDLRVSNGLYKQIFSTNLSKYGGNQRLSSKEKLPKASKLDKNKFFLNVKLSSNCMYIYEKSPCQK